MAIFELGAVGEFVSSIVVVLTLLYLAIQVAHNSKLAKAAIRENRTDSSQKILFAVGDLSEFVAKKRPGQELSTAEKIRYEIVIRALFRDMQAYSHQPKHGLLEESELSPCARPGGIR